jgi:hypothetical protein
MVQGMICETCRYNNPRGFVRKGLALEPCPDCGGTMVAHCCDGLTACNDPVANALDADAADESRYQRLAAERPEEGGDEMLH